MPPHDSALDAAVVTRTNLRQQLLGTWPELAEDSDTLLDTLAGIDDFEEQVVAVMRQVAEREAYAKALGELMAGMHERKQRLENGAKWLRAAVLHAMQEAKVPRIKAADMSLSVSPGKPRLVIVDAAAVPDEFVKVERTPKKKEIAEWLDQLDAMSAPNWVRWDAPTPFLSVHRR
jgi:hypothetical protein